MRCCTASLLPCMQGGVEVSDLAGTNASKSTCAKLRAWGCLDYWLGHDNTWLKKI